MAEELKTATENAAEQGFREEVWFACERFASNDPGKWSQVAHILHQLLIKSKDREQELKNAAKSTALEAIRVAAAAAGVDPAVLLASLGLNPDGTRTTVLAASRPRRTNGSNGAAKKFTLTVRTPSGQLVHTQHSCEYHCLEKAFRSAGLPKPASLKEWKDSVGFQRGAWTALGPISFMVEEEAGSEQAG